MTRDTSESSSDTTGSDQTSGDSDASANPDTSKNPDASGSSDSEETKETTAETQGPVEMRMWISGSGQPLSKDNEIQKKITDDTGVVVVEDYSGGNVSDDTVFENMALANDYPDFLYTNNSYGFIELMEAGKLVAWDDYLNDPRYSNLRSLYTDAQWDMFRQNDGHIYWADIRNTDYNQVSADRYQTGLAFWIQVRVLEWANYPKIETLDEYFKLLDDFYEEHKANADGTPIIPYTVLCEDWRNFCLEAAPAFLDGNYSDAGIAIDTSDLTHPKIVEYDTTDTAKRYYAKLNEAYQKRLLDQEFEIQTYDEYLEKLRSGRVLGMCDQYWDFANAIYDANGSFLDGDLGYDYVPVPLTIDPGMKNYWHVDGYTDTVYYESGVAVTTACKYPDMAFKFMNRLLDQDMMNLRFWGIEGTDYKVQDDGTFHREPFMRDRWLNSSYQANHVCQYAYLPHYRGYSRDGKNVMDPQDSTDDFLYGKPESVARCLIHYGYSSYTDFLHSEPFEKGKWFPLSTVTNIALFTDVWEAGQARSELKQDRLPKLVQSEDFDKDWEAYVKDYEAIGISAYFDDVQKELDKLSS